MLSTCAGIDRDVDAAAQLFLEPVDAGRALEVALAQLAQIDLEGIDDLGHARLDLVHHVLVGDFERDGELHELLAARPRS